MEENLLDKELDERQIRLLEEADGFDLEDFYLQKGASNGAVCLITQNQMLITDCYIKESVKRSYGTHRKTTDDIYQAIYGKEIEKVPYWEKQVIDDGNIIMELCSTVPSTIHIPNEISNRQYEMLENFVNRINMIVYSNHAFFNEHPIEFTYILGDDIQEYDSVNELTSLLEKINRSKRR